MNKIIDFHTHAFPDFLAPKALAALSQHSGDYKPFIDGTVSGLLQSMDKYSINKSLIANIATKPEQAEVIIKWSKEIRSNRIIPLCSVHPKSINVEKELENIKLEGFNGIKLHPMYQNFTVDDKSVYNVYEKAMSLGLFILFHAGYDMAFPGDRKATPKRFANIKKQFPDLTIIASHFGGWHDWEDVLTYIAGTDIYLDTSFIEEMDIVILEKIINKHDKEKIFFGSDSPWLSQGKEIDFVCQLIKDKTLVEKIQYKNGEMFLQKYGL